MPGKARAQGQVYISTTNVKYCQAATYSLPLVEGMSCREMLRIISISIVHYILQTVEKMMKNRGTLLSDTQGYTVHAYQV